MEHNSGVTLPVVTPLSLNCESFELNEWFASFCNGNITAMNCGSSSELMEIAQSSKQPVNFSGFTPDAQQERISPLSDALFAPNQLHAESIEAQAHLSSNFGAQFQQLPAQSELSINKSDRESPGVSLCSNDCYILTSTSTQSQRPLEMWAYEPPNVFLKRASTPLSCRTSQGVSSLASFSETGELVVYLEKAVQQNFGGSIEDQSPVPLINGTLGELLEKETGLERVPEGFELCDLTTDICYESSMYDPSEWSTPPPNISGLKNMGIENVLQSTIVSSTTSDVVGDGLLDNLFNQPVNSVKSPITNTTSTDVHQNSVLTNGDHSPLEGLGLEVWCGQDGGYWEDLLKPVVGCNLLDVSTGVSKYMPKLDPGSFFNPRKGLFSELGIEELLDGSSNSTCVSKSSTSDQVSTVKKRRTENPVASDKVHSVSVSCSSDITRQDFDSLGTTRDLSMKEFFPKSQVGLWIDDSYSISNRNTVLETPKKLEEQSKAMKKRARPGESTRPRPKDRQQIQDRIKELRGIIPDSTKCSIDSLLDRTIKHMLFLQSVTKCADKLKQTNQPKLFGQENVMVLEDNINCSAGACPVIVEELCPAGLILIEMLCEDRGLFLEIADAIRGFGLNIMRGIMETREDKILARFIVEAKTHVTRVEIFLAILELLHQTTTTVMDSTNVPSDAFNGRIPLVNNYHQSTSHCAINIADRHP